MVRGRSMASGEEFQVSTSWIFYGEGGAGLGSPSTASHLLAFEGLKEAEVSLYPAKHS